MLNIDTYDMLNNYTKNCYTKDLLKFTVLMFMTCRGLDVCSRTKCVCLPTVCREDQRCQDPTLFGEGDMHAGTTARVC